MSGRSACLFLVRSFARVMLLVYPRDFRRRFADSFLETAEHRWQVEHDAGHNAPIATVKTVLLLFVDMLHAAPAERERGRATSRSVTRSGVIIRVLSDTFGDLRTGARALFRRPKFSLLIATTLGLGIGVSAAAFGGLDRVILRPLPYPDADRMAYIGLRLVERGWTLSPYHEVIERWREGAATVERIEMYRSTTVTETGDGPARLLSVTDISGTLPGMLGVVPAAGRMLGPSDALPGAPHAVMLSEHLWHQRFGSDPTVVGRTLRLNDSLYTIAGVWPKHARLDYDEQPDLLRTLPDEVLSGRGGFTLVLARLREGVSVAEVEADLAASMQGVEPVSGRAVTPVLQPSYGFLGESYVRGLWTVFAGGLLLMVVALANAGNLMLTRATSRRRELGIRVALGGSTLRLARLFFVESSILSAAGVLLGLVVAAGTGNILESLEPGRFVPINAAGLDDRAIAFAVVLAILAAVACALMPVAHMRSAPLPLIAASGIGHEGSSVVRNVLVVAQGALAVLLLTGASMLGRSFIQLMRVDLGIDVERLAIVSLRMPDGESVPAARQRAFFESVASIIESMPGVSAVATASTPPLDFSLRGGSAYLDNETVPTETGGEFIQTAGGSPGYFQTLGIPMVRGRDFTDGESGVVIVNQSFAAARGGEIVGRRLYVTRDTVPRTVVGVVGDVYSYRFSDGENRPQVYYPSGMDGSYNRFVIRTAGDPAELLVSLRRVLAESYPEIPLRAPTTGPELVRDHTTRTRFVAFLLIGFAVLGSLLAVAGIYGAVSLDVTRRTRELALRLALGASAGQTIRYVVARGMRMAVIGIVVGVGVALSVSQVLESLLFQVPVRDPWSLAAGAGILAAAAALGCLVPARKASRLQPTDALRVDG